MSIEYRVSHLQPEVRHHLDALRARIERAFPGADFVVYEGQESSGLYLAVISDAEDGFDVLDLAGDHLVDLLVDEDIAIYVHHLVDLLVDEDIAIYVVPVHRTPPAASGPNGQARRRYRAMPPEPPMP